RRRSVLRLADDRVAASLQQPAGETAEAGMIVHDQHRLRHARIVARQRWIRALGKSPIFTAGALGSGISSMRPARTPPTVRQRAASAATDGKHVGSGG